MKVVVHLLFLLILLPLVIQAQDDHKKITLEQGFKNPPTEARPKGYWCLVNGNLDLTQMTEELKEYKEKGIGTLDLWDVAGWVDPDSVVPAGPPFMSDESVQAIAHAIREAGRIGVDIGLTISSSWNAGGSWIEAQDGVMGLFESTLQLRGPSQYKGAIPFPEVPQEYGRITMILEKDDQGLPTFYREVAVLAYATGPDSTIVEVRDISDHFTNGKLNWKVPPGNWEVKRYVCTGTGQPLMRPSPNSNGLMVDHFKASAMEKHLRFFFEKLEAELGDLSQTALKYLYTDSYEANSAVWTVQMPEEFKKRRGYDLTPYLPVLSGYTVESEDISQRFLFDYKKTLSDLIIENHYALGVKLCQEKGLDFIAEAGGPGPPIHNVPFESLKSLGVLSVPRGEFWFDPMWTQERIDRLQIVKGPASAAHLYDQPRVEAEAFTGTQIWQFGPGDLKATADRAMCEGLTSFVYHTSPHIPREAGKPGWVYNFGTIINTTRAWWPKSAGFHHYLGRSCFLLQQGNFVADVLYYYGDHAPNFVSHKKIDPNLGFGYDYDVCNSDIILNRLDVKDGYFVLPHGQRYKVLVLPEADQMVPAVLEKIKALVKKGGVIVGPKPARAHSLTNDKQNDKKVNELARQIWDTPQAKGMGKVYADRSKLRSILQSDLSVVPDVQVGNAQAIKNLDFIHRQTDGVDIYFFRNTTGQTQVYELTLRSVQGAPEWWNPNEGTITPIPVFNQQNETTTFPIKLEGYGSAFVVFRNQEVKKSIQAIWKDNEQLFPSNQNYLPVSFTDKGLVFEEAGSYYVQFADGNKANYDIGSPAEVSISGAWEIRFPHGWGAPQRTTFDSLISWTASADEGIRHFSGVAVYHKTFELTEKTLKKGQQIKLELGHVSKVAEVYLNGKRLGTQWFAPYDFDITDAVRPGKNYLIVEVANVMSNQMTGDASREGRERRTHSNITKGPNAWMTPYKELRLIESGLMGPVKVVAYERHVAE